MTFEHDPKADKARARNRKHNAKRTARSIIKRSMKFALPAHAAEVIRLFNRGKDVATIVIRMGKPASYVEGVLHAHQVAQKAVVA